MAPPPPGHLSASTAFRPPPSSVFSARSDARNSPAPHRALKPSGLARPLQSLSLSACFACIALFVFSCFSPSSVLFVAVLSRFPLLRPFSCAPRRLCLAQTSSRVSASGLPDPAPRSHLYVRLQSRSRPRTAPRTSSVAPSRPRLSACCASRSLGQSERQPRPASREFRHAPPPETLPRPRTHFSTPPYVGVPARLRTCAPAPRRSFCPHDFLIDRQASSRPHFRAPGQSSHHRGCICVPPRAVFMPQRQHLRAPRLVAALPEHGTFGARTIPSSAS